MFNGIKQRLGWESRLPDQHDADSLARALGLTKREGRDCLPRRQGNCPGIEYCPDCSWSEGSQREQ